MVGHPFGGCMCAMRRGKRIVAIDIPQSGDARRERGVVLFFARIESDVLQQDHICAFRFNGHLLGPVECLDERD